MKKRVLFLAIISMFILTGCSDLEKKLEKYIIHFSGIEDDKDYQQAQDLRMEGKLNAEDEYNLLDEEYLDEEDEKKQVHVTIANNNFLTIDYFYDSERTEKVEGTSIYLNPGEKLYYSQPESSNTKGTYSFSQFQIYQYDADGNKGGLYAETGEESVALEIQEGYKGTELAIIPIGIYEKRGLEFKAFYYDDGNEKPVSGVWRVNDEEYYENNVEIDDNEVVVKYEYDENTYYYVEATPSPFSANTPGIVEFKKSNVEQSYSVRLHRYITAEFSYDSNSNKGIVSIMVNGDNKELEEAIQKLKVGDQIIVTTNDDYRIYCGDFKMESAEKIDDGYRYTITIPEVSGNVLRFKVYKSELKIVLNKSVGNDILIDIIGAEINEKNCHYSSGMRSDCTILDETIGVEEKLSIVAKDDRIASGYALKVEVKKTDGNGEKTEEIKYARDLPKTIDVDLYGEIQEIANWNKIYKSVIIRISLVPVDVYHKKAIENGTISVRLIDSSGEQNLSEGDILETSREVEVAIIPNEGHYVSGNKVDNYQYTNKMKFSKYLSDIDDIIENHEIKKLYQVTLDVTDAYGKCVYKLNGNVISNTETIYVREEDHLVLEYELTDVDYQIIRQSEGFWDEIDNWRKNVFSETKETETIVISSNIDGTTIRRENYIQVQKKGE